jgi:hypothetical protein
MRADELIRRLISGELTIYSVVRTSPEPSQKAIEFGGFRNVTNFNVKNVDLGDRTDSTGREWATFNYNKLQAAMCKHVPRLVTFIWVGMHFCGVGTGEYEPFGSFAAFPCLNSLRLDYELFVEQSPESGVEGKLPDCEALRRYVPSTLKHFAICSIDWLTVQTIYKQYLETEEAQPGFLDSLFRFIASLNIDKVFITINMGGWLRDPPTSQLFPIKEPAVDLLRHISDTLKGLGTRFDVE